MLFHVTWEFIDPSEEGQKRSLSVFSKWEPPAGADFSKGFYGFTDGTGGVALIEVDSAQTLARTIDPWTPWLRFEVTPIIPIEEDADRERGRRLPRLSRRLIGTARDVLRPGTVPRTCPSVESARHSRSRDCPWGMAKAYVSGAAPQNRRRSRHVRLRLTAAGGGASYPLEVVGREAPGLRAVLTA